jgi:hypothetical protein
MHPLQQLSREDVKILVTLWANLQVPVPIGHKRSLGLTREELAAELVGDVFHSQNTLFSHLTQLATLTNLLKIEEIQARGDTHRGNHRHVYSLNEGKAITSPASAWIAMGVWNAPGRRIDEEYLVEVCASQSLRNHEKGTAYTKPMIEAAIKALIENQYLSRFGGDLSKELTVSDRFRTEEEYVFAVALKCLMGTPPRTVESSYPST